MKPISELTQFDATPSLFLQISEQEVSTLPVFRTDDVVLMNAARDEEEWLTIAQACTQSGARLLVAASTDTAEQLAGQIREEQVTVCITTARQWTQIYNQLNKASGTINRLKVILMDTHQAPEQRYALIPSALSKARIENTYEAYQKAPWIQKNTKA